MLAIEIIQKKRDRYALEKHEIEFLIDHYVRGILPDYQMASFLMAVCINGMRSEEISWLTKAMLYSGEVITHSSANKNVIDKHSTGGVGDKISIPLAPLLASCGIKVPMIAGRGLGHTGGTLDKLESIPGFRCNLDVEHYRKQVQSLGCVIMGQTEEIAPADKKMYALRDVTGTVESIPLIASSIMSKKLAEGLDGLVLDVKHGKGAFMKTLEDARKLASTMVDIGTHMNKEVTAYLTSMEQPLGTMIGNTLEIIESIDILHGRGPQDSMDLTLKLGAEMLLLARAVDSLEEGQQKLLKSIENGSAFSTFLAMVKAQGGDTKYISNPKLFAQAHKTIPILSPKDGFVASIDSRALGLAVCVLGGGRMKLSDIIDPRVGIEMHAKIGHQIVKGQPLCTLHVEEKGVEEARARVEQAIDVVRESVCSPSLITERISSHS